MAWVRVPLFAGLLCAACMCLSTVASIGFLSTLLTVTPGDRVGRVQSAAGFLSSLVQPFGPLAGGALLTAYGSRTTFGAIAGVLAVSAAIVTFAPSARPGSAAPEEAPAPDDARSDTEAADEADARPAPQERPVPDAPSVPDATPAPATAGIPTDRTGAGSPRP